MLGCTGVGRAKCTMRRSEMKVEAEPVTFVSDGLRLVGDHWSAGPSARGIVLLLHGGGQRRYSWHTTGARLARNGWTACALDARGHGDSDWPDDGDYSIAALSRDLVAVQRELGERPVLVGASMGGMTALAAEGEVGGLARALVLVDVTPRMEQAGIERIRRFMSQAADGFGSLQEVADAIRSYNPRRPPPRNLDGLRKNVREHGDGRFYWHWDPRLLDGGDEPTQEMTYLRSKAAAAAVTVPTLLVHGGASDLVSQAGVDEFLALIPSARVESVREAGHMVAGDDNDVFSATLLDFLGTLADDSARSDGGRTRGGTRS